MFGLDKGILKIQLPKYMDTNNAVRIMSNDALAHLDKSKFNKIAIDFKDIDIPMEYYQGLIQAIVQHIGYANFKYKVTILNVRDIMTKTQVKAVLRKARIMSA